SPSLSLVIYTFCPTCDISLCSEDTSTTFVYYKSCRACSSCRLNRKAQGVSPGSDCDCIIGHHRLPRRGWLHSVSHEGPCYCPRR
ncbi:hypothetical protein BGY98DRAFT_1011270, partial [Russula aff. rugulosa BPL654]